jgi:hypothetical protein
MALSVQRSVVGQEHLRVVEPREARPQLSARVLRIGVVERGRIIEEQFIRRGANVTVGSSERNQIVVHSVELPSRYELFRYRNGSYHLAFDETMSGRVLIEGQVVDLQSLRLGGRAQRRGSSWLIDLSDEARGKIVIGEHTLLFQMVNPPPVQPKPQLPASVRSGWIKNIDWVMTTIVAASFVVQFGMVTWLVHQDWPVVPTWDGMRDIPDVVFTPPSKTTIDQTLSDLQPPADAPIMDDPSPSPSEVTDGTPRPSTQPNRRPGQGRSDEPNKGVSAEDVRARLTAAADSMARAKIIGAFGGSNSQVVDDVLAGGGASVDQDEVMEQVSGVRVASANETVFRQPAGGDNSSKRAITIDSMRGVPVGDSNVSSGDFGGESEIRGDVARQNPTIAGGAGVLDSAGVRRVVGSHLSAIKRCYERELRHNRTLAGRITISFTIGGGGRVVQSASANDTMGSSVVASCIASEFRRMRFDEPAGGNVSFSYPFIFRPAQ